MVLFDDHPAAARLAGSRRGKPIAMMRCGGDLERRWQPTVARASIGAGPELRHKEQREMPDGDPMAMSAVATSDT